MIVITAKFHPKPEDVERWPDIVAEFTAATRAEPGCLWFDWSRSLEDPGEYVLIEAFVDGQAGGTHVNSAHFKQAQQDLPPHLSATPKILSFEADADGWSDLGELTVSS